MRVTRNAVVVLAAALATLYSGACSDDRMSPTAPSPSQSTGMPEAFGAVPVSTDDEGNATVERRSRTGPMRARPGANHETVAELPPGMSMARLQSMVQIRNANEANNTSSRPGRVRNLTFKNEHGLTAVRLDWNAPEGSGATIHYEVEWETRRGECDNPRGRPCKATTIGLLGKATATIHYSNFNEKWYLFWVRQEGGSWSVIVGEVVKNTDPEPEPEPEPETMQPPRIEWVAVHEWAWSGIPAKCRAFFTVQLDESTLTEGSERVGGTRRKGVEKFTFITPIAWTTSSRLTRRSAGWYRAPGEIEFVASQRKDGVTTEDGPVFSKYVAADPSDDCGRTPGGVRNLTVTWEDDSHVTVRWKEPSNVVNEFGGLPITRYELGDVRPGNCPDSRFPFREVRVTDDVTTEEETYEHRLRIGGANAIEEIGVRAVNVKGHGACVTATVDGQGGTEPSAPTWTARGRTWTCNAPDAPRCRADQQVRVSTGVEGRKEVQLRYARQGSAAQESDWAVGTGTEVDTTVSLLPVEYTVQARYRTDMGTSPWSDAGRLHAAPGAGDRFSTELQNRPLPGPRNVAAVKTGGRWTLTWRTPSGAGLPITGYDYGFVRNAPGTNRQPCSFVRRNKATFAPHWNDGGFSGTVDDPGNEYRYIGVEAVDFMEGGECARIEIEREVRDPDPVPGTPFTAELDGPARHQGAGFEVTLTFSRSDLSLSYSTIRDDALEVSGGKVESARRAQSGSDQGWIVRVNPDNGHSAVDITLPVRECSETGAICTRGGEKLSAPATRTVQP